MICLSLPLEYRRFLSGSELGNVIKVNDGSYERERERERECERVRERI